MISIHIYVHVWNRIQKGGVPHLKKGAFDCQPSLQSLEALNLCTLCTTLGSSYIVSLKAGQVDKIVSYGLIFF